MKQEAGRNRWVWLEAAGGVAVLGAVWGVGLATGWFTVHVVYPLGFWLVFDGLAAASGERTLLRRPALFVRMALVGAALGLVLDFYMAGLTRILELTAVADAGIALQMYLGWGLCLPAVYQSYRVLRRLAGDADWSRRWLVPEAWYRRALGPLGLLGFVLAALPLFFRLWVGSVPGYFVVPSFAGLWLLAEHVQGRRGRSSLLTSLLAADPRPLAAMVVASIPFTLLWEGLNALMGSWRYQNLFWLEPTLAGVPLVVFFGYLCGYYVLFLSTYGAVRSEDEDEVPLWTEGARRKMEDRKAQRPLESHHAGLHRRHLLGVDGHFDDSQPLLAAPPCQWPSFRPGR